MRTLLAASLMALCLVLPISSAQEQTEPCVVEALWERMPIFSMPLENYGSEFMYVPKGKQYEVLAIRDFLGGRGELYDSDMYLIRVDEETTGWISHFTGLLLGDCAAIPRDTIPQEEYDGICLATDENERQFYITARTVDGYNVYCGHANTCSRTLAETQVVQPCETLPFQPGQMTTTTAVHLYASPNSEAPVVAGLASDTIVFAIEATSPDDPARLWYRVITESHFIGWVVHTAVVPPGQYIRLPVQGTGTISAETNLWTAPDAETGQVFTTTREDLPVEVMLGPVPGRIRRDSDLVGNWYYIHVMDSFMHWWVWEGRLTIDVE